VELPYRASPINISKGEQHAPAFLKISPNNRIPAIVDTDPAGGGEPLSLFESGAILLYLAEKTGKLLPKDKPGYWTAVQWLMWQMAGFGPMLGQLGHFKNYAPEPLPYAIDRYSNEAGRLYRVLDLRLGAAEYLAGDYGIADIAVFPWSRGWERHGQKLDEIPNFKRWFTAISERPAVKKGLTVLADRTRQGPIDEKSRENLFGKAQYARR
jgi:GSH-dependent disulfide-bond oxidoreductase